MRIKWLDLAVDDLDDIAGYISQDNPEAARRTVRRLWTSVKSLAEQPEMGRPGRVHGTRELVVNDTPFVVPYRVVGSEIEILRVLHGARDWPKSF
ncbi:MAG: type II toxin-antitoxin system RelE/ParE family toxin [bacterium]|nr:type II toxin-antitoxin system RelE/ParE family toxin [bacterium]